MPLHTGRPKYVRDYLKHKISLHEDGRLEYETYVQIECKRDGLSDIQHSVHMNYSLCLPTADNLNPKLINLTRRGGEHEVFFEPSSSNPKKSSWKIRIVPPLRKGERLHYGWKNELRHFLIQRDGNIEYHSSPHVKLTDALVKHQWFVNHPTNYLELRIEIYDRAIVGSYMAIAYEGRSYLARAIDRVETEKMLQRLAVNDVSDKKEIIVMVDKPLTQRTYAFHWTVRR